jgi:hypothetical protein
MELGSVNTSADEQFPPVRQLRAEAGSERTQVS